MNIGFFSGTVTRQPKMVEMRKKYGTHQCMFTLAQDYREPDEKFEGEYRVRESRSTFYVLGWLAEYFVFNFKAGDDVEVKYRIVERKKLHRRLPDSKQEFLTFFDHHVFALRRVGTQWQEDRKHSRDYSEKVPLHAAAGFADMYK